MKRPEELRNDCIDLIVKTLSQTRVSSKIRGLKLWMTEECFDELFDIAYTPENMVERIKGELENKGHEVLADLPMDIETGRPATDQVILIKDDKIFYEKILQTHATVCQLPGKGTMHQSTYSLPFKEGAVYNIGRGIIPDMTGTYRENFIAVKEKEDEKDAKMREINQYVSSAHADIKVLNGRFCLHATLRGCKAGTKILRDGREINLTSTDLYEPLKDQDIIILGKMFMMRYSD